ncbi:Tol-Pal system beta propeller repeat protein TolB [Sandarakinorhabdus rubra]|uniref:Tol-Pal system beta propeller repeat protein TolB n=1 Tax=Sandarakinorhabdus rubra TaxID=2672568 RepID=UPI0013DCBF98|nr:Tol-Pal system beta propeller repeat protein TolB [Sandarakinorhabdus rubra]
MRLIPCLLALAFTGPVFAQDTAPPAAAGPLRVDINAGLTQPMPIAVPAFAPGNGGTTEAGTTTQLGERVAQVIANDLKSSGLFRPLDPAAFTTTVDIDDVLKPEFAAWRTIAAQALVTGTVTANPDGGLTLACYAYDVFAGSEIARAGFATTAAGWRRAAHKCADLVYTRLTGESGYFDSRIVYISETGPRTKRIKRLAIMDQDGAQHRFLTSGQNLVLTPRFAPAQQTITYMSFENNRPRVWLYTLGSGRQQAVGDFNGMSFAPRFSPDGQSLVYSMAVGGNTDIWRHDIATRQSVRLTTAPGIDTSPSFSPDGRQIVFESDRGGSQQLYVMNADGSGQRRISFGEGRSASPVWSPRGDYVAFTRIGGGRFGIGVMRPDGSGERLLTNGYQDEGPSWSPNGRVILFSRSDRAGRSGLWSVDISGLNERRLATPLDASDPAWSPLLP